MTWIGQHLPHLLSVVATVYAAKQKADKYLSLAAHLVPNSVWQLVKAVILKQPIKAQHEGGINMFNLAGLKAFADEVEAVAERIGSALAKIAEVGSPIAEVVGTVSGHPEVTAGAAAADAIAKGLDSLITEHQNAGSTPQSAVASLAKLANTVVTALPDGTVPESTVSQVKAITAAVESGAYTVTG